MTLEEHARSELGRLGWLSGDNIQSGQAMLDAVIAFSKGGWSGGSAPFGIAIVNDLLNYRPLGPLTSDDREWQYVHDDPDCWQSRRRPDAFSEDGGLTYYCLDELPVRHDFWPWLKWKLKLGEHPPGYTSPGRDMKKLKRYKSERPGA